MSFDKKDIQRLAGLARLSIDDEPNSSENSSEHFVNQLTSNLNSILQLVDQISSLDTNNVTPLYHPYEITQRLREDNVTEKNEREELQKLAPKVEAGLYLVPKVIE